MSKVREGKTPFVIFKLSPSFCVSTTQKPVNTAKTFSLSIPLSYIRATADGHVRVAWGDPLSWAGARQVIVIDAAGIVAGDGREGIQRQIPVQQTARQAQRATDRLLKHCCVFIVS